MGQRIGKHFWGKCLIFIVLCLSGLIGKASEAEAGLLNNPYVTFSPDGNAFTTNADERNTKWYDAGYTINIDNVSTLGEPGIGEHLYTVIKTGDIPVNKWVVEHAPARCIHNQILTISNYHGVEFSKEICYREYYSGWMAYCADCNQKVVNRYIYMSAEAAKSIRKLDMSLAYYYRCPHCTHLEQGYEFKQHICKAISANQYAVRYHANFGRGYMPKSIHMYNNATEYEGHEITPQKTLTLNSYVRTGYEFTGWNTKMDGSGQHFDDGEEILNLSAEEQGNVILYAQWKKSRSTLWIDPCGGMYNGSGQILRVPGEYGSQYVFDMDRIIPPSGAKVHFETNGGNDIEDITGDMEFSEWSFEQPFHGELENNIYTYKGKNGAEDYVKAVYDYKAIILPKCQKQGASFAGWYFDKEMTRMAGAAGEEFKTAKNITLYACWVDLKLESTVNSFANEGKGAVDLSWEQKDNREKTYLLYQKQEGGIWEKIHSAEDVSVEKTVNREYTYTGRTESYVIPYTGYYRLTLYGAQGENYKSFQGGKGGMVTAVVYLRKGEVLKFTVGGQNGYNGGGVGTSYGNGGGYTCVGTDEMGNFLIAGGGGGATSLINGRPGGSLSGNVAGQQGQKGMAGGGGGFRGGAAGTAILHKHKDSCFHEHIGSPEKYGGCYTVKEQCKNTSFTNRIYKEVFYYGDRDNEGNHIFCVRCASYSCPGHLTEYYEYQCTVCKQIYRDTKPNACSFYKYKLGCHKNVGYICGYTEGEVINTTAAYGGSNYASAAQCLTYEEKADVKKENGSLRIEAVHVGFLDVNYLKGVKAEDKAAPDPISPDTVEIKAVDENKINVVFRRPEDNGTLYYHMAESYDRVNHMKISTSNQTMDRVESGVCGYYYKLDQYAHTVVTVQDQQYLSTDANPYIGVVLKGQHQYLHIGAVDKAGNLSATVHIPLSPNEVIFWPVITEGIRIRQEEQVFQKGDAYYVKADGTTAFKVSFNSRLCGTARSDYQINQLYFEAQNVTAGEEEGILKFLLPVQSAISSGTSMYFNEEIQKQYANAFCLADASFTTVRRSNYCKDAEITQAFSISEELDGCRIRLTPRAGVCMENVNVISDKQTDLANSIYLIADGKGPVITGLDIPEEIVNQKDGKWKYTLQITAQDTGSGIKEFSLEIQNSDSGAYEKIEDTDGDGYLVLELNPENPLFSGRFTLLATAKDNVGNESVETYGMDGITLQAYVEKVLDPQEEAFKKGETGKLHIQAFGYMDRIEVFFPEEWSSLNPALNKVFIYEVPDFMQKEEISFMVPLQVPDAEYTIVVKAYKSDKMLEADPELLTISVTGSVLDEIRTRLR